MLFGMVVAALVVLWVQILVSLASVGRSQQPVKLVYLGGSHRFTETSAYDFYFSCNVRGRNLQWVINGTGYAAYHHGQILTTVPVHRESLANFNYTSTLLSLKVDGDYQKLDSVLFVSVQDNITINVCCVSDTGRNISSNREVPKSQSEYKQATSSDGHISMFHLWDGPVVSNDGDNTRCFMCGVDFSNQFWETSNNDQLTFDTGFPLGSESNLPSIDNSVLRLQTILFAHSPKLVSLFLVTDSTVVNVTCNAGGMSLSSTQLRIVQGTSTVEDIDNLTIPDVTTNNLVGSQRTFETITEDEELKSTSSLVYILSGIIGITIIVVVVALVVGYIMIKKKSKAAVGRVVNDNI